MLSRKAGISSECIYKTDLSNFYVTIISCEDPRCVGMQGKILMDYPANIRFQFQNGSFTALSKKNLLFSHLTESGGKIVFSMEDTPELKKRIAGNIKSKKFLVGV